MKRVLVDTNILLDVLFQREPHVLASEAVWKACEDGRCEGYITPLTPVNIFYLARKRVPLRAARLLVEDILNIFQLAPLGYTEMDNALRLEIADYEDAVQLAGALSAGLEAIVTRNVSDFAGSPVPILTPIDLFKNLE
jgi:predicted nucleic acid-binding protein